MSDTKKAKVIAIANQKGGVGKTTSTINIGVGLAKLGKKVLLIDIDAQAHLTKGLGINPKEQRNTITEILIELRENKKIPDDIEKYVIKNKEGVDLIVANQYLSGESAMIESVKIARDKLLKKLIKPFLYKYDFILFDCPPALGLLTVNALCASDEVIIPTQAQYFSLDGSELLVESIMEVKEEINTDLIIGGILVTMVDARTNEAQLIISDIHKNYGEHVRVFKMFVPHSVRASESNRLGKSIFEHDSKGKVAKAYMECVKEIING